LDLVFRTQRGTALNPNHASRGFANLARSVELDATRTCCATRWPRPWRPTRNPPPSSPRNWATPTAAPSPSASTSTNLSFGVASKAELEAAVQAFEERGVEHGGITDLPPFGIAVLPFKDPDGLALELTAPL
jgi:hypothetical protein